MSLMSKKSAIVVSALLAVVPSWAGDLEWSGVYRIEGNQLHSPLLDSGDGKRKEYGVHTLILRPKIVAADGLYINAQINIFNSDNANTDQLGSYFGHGLGTVPSSSSADSNALSENQASEEVRISQFYLTHVQEYGSLLVGRAPMHFGLGMTHNGGRGLFDHFADTRDLVGYKIVMGNFYFFPSYAKINEGGLSSYDDVNELNYHLQYENPESDTAMGVIYQNRKASQGGNDTPPAAIGGATVDGQYNAKNFNIFYKKETEDYSVGFEIAQQGGSSGVENSTGQGISLSGFGVALEFDWHPKGQKTAYGVKTGFATGDDPSTTDEFEGFIFDRNYDVAIFLFNHGLGQADVLHTRSIGRMDTGADSLRTVNAQPDVEAISNVTYLSPYMRYKWSDKWSLIGVLTTGWLNDDTINVGGTGFKAKADLGYELDLSLQFNISDKITWLNQFGYLIPGDAWKAGGNFDSDSMYGFVTKAAVSF